MDPFENSLFVNGAFTAGEVVCQQTRHARGECSGIWCWLNTRGVMGSEMPHGGMRNSGYGSDLSMQSLIEYSQVRHLMFATDA